MKTEIDLEKICIVIGCSGLNIDCPGNVDCQILRKIIDEKNR